MRHGHLRIDALFPQVEQRKAGGEHLAEDHALTKARPRTKADATRKCCQYGFDAPLVLCIKMRETVAHNNPVDLSPIAHGATLATLPDHLAVNTWPFDAIGLRIHTTEQVEIHEA